MPIFLSNDCCTNFIFNDCFSDESTIEILDNRTRFVRRKRGEEFLQACVVDPDKQMVWSIISCKGTGRLYEVKGMMNMFQYKEVLETRLAP